MKQEAETPSPIALVHLFRSPPSAQAVAAKKTLSLSTPSPSAQLCSPAAAALNANANANGTAAVVGHNLSTPTASPSPSLLADVLSAVTATTTGTANNASTTTANAATNPAVVSPEDSLPHKDMHTKIHTHRHAVSPETSHDVSASVSSMPVRSLRLDGQDYRKHPWRYDPAAHPEFLSNPTVNINHREVTNYVRVDPRLSRLQHCVMCGRHDVLIPSQNKNICKACDSAFWLHIQWNVVLKFCKGCKNFFTLEDFADKPEGTKCCKCRQRGRENYLNKKAAGSASKPESTMSLLLHSSSPGMDSPFPQNTHGGSLYTDSPQSTAHNTPRISDEGHSAQSPLFYSHPFAHTLSSLTSPRPQSEESDRSAVCESVHRLAQSSPRTQTHTLTSFSLPAFPFSDAHSLHAHASHSSGDVVEESSPRATTSTTTPSNKTKNDQIAALIFASHDIFPHYHNHFHTLKSEPSAAAQTQKHTDTLTRMVPLDGRRKPPRMPRKMASLSVQLPSGNNNNNNNNIINYNVDDHDVSNVNMNNNNISTNVISLPQSLSCKKECNEEKSNRESGNERKTVTPSLLAKRERETTRERESRVAASKYMITPSSLHLHSSPHCDSSPVSVALSPSLLSPSPCTSHISMPRRSATLSGVANGVHTEKETQIDNADRTCSRRDGDAELGEDDQPQKRVCREKESAQHKLINFYSVLTAPQRRPTQSGEESVAVNASEWQWDPKVNPLMQLAMLTASDMTPAERDDNS